MQAGVGELSLHGLDKLVDEIQIVLARHAFVPPAEIFRAVQVLRVVGSEVEHHRQSTGRMNAAKERVKGKLPDRYAQAADALVADTQDALAVGDHNHVDLGMRAVSEQHRNRIAHGIGDENAPRPPVNVAELPTAQGHDRRVNDRRHLLHVVE